MGDEYSPFLAHLKEKYSRRNQLTNIHLDEYKRLSNDTKTGREKIFKDINSVVVKYDEALSTLNEFSSAITLANKESQESSFNHIVKEDYEAIKDPRIERIVKEFQTLSNNCVHTLYNKECLINRKEEAQKTEDEVMTEYKKLLDYNLKNYTKVYPEDLIAVVKNIKDHLVSFKEHLSTNNDVFYSQVPALEIYSLDLGHMISYLNSKTAIKVSDYDPSEHYETPSIGTFERDFRNLLASIRFICHNAKKPFYIPKDYKNTDPNDKTPDDKIKRIIEEFVKGANKDNIVIEKDDDITDFEEKNLLDCMKNTNWNETIMKSPCFKKLPEDEKEEDGEKGDDGKTNNNGTNTDDNGDNTGDDNKNNTIPEGNKNNTIPEGDNNNTIPDIKNNTDLKTDEEDDKPDDNDGDDNTDNKPKNPNGDKPGKKDDVDTTDDKEFDERKSSGGSEGIAGEIDDLW